MGDCALGLSCLFLAMFLKNDWLNMCETLWADVNEPK